MPSDRRATILAILAWLAHLGTGNIVVERWRVGLQEELAAMPTSPAGGNVTSKGAANA
jgi:hypothetical protein